MSIHHSTSGESLQQLHEEARNRPSSIDLSLELERQLEIDSLPNTPDVPNTRFSERPQSLDPQVLASIVTQLRSSLTDVSKERDSLARTRSEVQEREANLKDALHTVSRFALSWGNTVVSTSQIVPGVGSVPLRK